MPPVSILSALADPTRCRIVEILHGGAKPVHVLAAGFDISRPAISRHLRVLREAGLVSEKKTGRENLYVLHAKKLAPAEKWLTQFNAKPSAQPSAQPQPQPQPQPQVAVKVRTKKPVAAPKAVEQVQVAAPAAPKAVKPAKPAKQVEEAPASQMGFDF
ncbi:ArsR/SmtB family transcription factor [Devosia epidermidihirudinis]|uniref:ArsR/SmtB family transcription factor n=1 Tax=Devosia epidermidihirudinis TaxID=1293439 RepID=UPI0006980C8A|nr:metalloregulator ArsR/SmtB family transcription factor [Devosia epidermidihirudinis]